MQQHAATNVSLSVEEDVLKNLEPKLRELVLNVYLLGSRLHGTATESSDWDLFLLVSSRITINGEELPESLTVTCSKGELDMQIVSVKELESTMSRTFCIDELCLLWLPESSVLLENYQFPRSFRIDLSLLEASVNRQIENVLKAAEGFIEFNKYIYKGKKIVVIALFFLDLMTQLVEHGKMVDFQSVQNTYKPRILNEHKHLTDWNSIYEEYGMIIRAFRNNFSNAIQQRKLVSQDMEVFR